MADLKLPALLKQTTDDSTLSKAELAQIRKAVQRAPEADKQEALRFLNNSCYLGETERNKLKSVLGPLKQQLTSTFCINRFSGAGRIDTSSRETPHAGLGGRAKRRSLENPWSAEVLQKRVSQGFQYEYEKRLARNPSLRGAVILSFRVDKDGNVTGIKATSRTLTNRNSDDFLKALEARADANLKRASKVPPPNGQPMRVKMPLVFKSGS